MVISHEKRFVLLLPWKTASQTLSLRLGPYNDSPYEPFFYFNAYLNRVVHPHVTCSEFACLPESKLGYLLAAFVRNPYDRVYSGFRQLQVDLRTHPHATYSERWVHVHVMEQLSENFAQLLRAEFDFDRWVDRLDEEQIYEVGRNTSFPLHPAHYWTHVAGQQAIDFIVTSARLIACCPQAVRLDHSCVDTGLFDASLFVDLHRMPELFCGFVRRPGEGPTLYPVACGPQSWAAASVYLLLQACLGLVIVAPRSRIRFTSVK